MSYAMAWAPQQKGLIVDGFAGPGGWGEGLRRFLRLPELGLEYDGAACQTRAAAGHATIRCDATQYPTHVFAGRIRGKIDSPPCQAWSRTGNGLGLVDQPLVQQAVHDLAHGRDTRAALLKACKDPRSLLAAEPMRWHYDLRPVWIAMEEVPDVLPLFRQYAQYLRGFGYSVWMGVLNAADYGVPQTRRRAVLLASRERDVTAPQPTHAEHAEVDSLFGAARPEWVSMGQVLDRPGPFEVISNYGTGGNAQNRGRRSSDEPAFTVTSKVSRCRLVAPDGSELPRLSHAEAGMLQSFPAHYPWSGTDVPLQIGNAVPPLLAAHIVSAATGIPVRQHLVAAA